MGSIVVDYCIRHKTGQPSLPLWCIEQVPTWDPISIDQTSIDFVAKRVAELVVSGSDVKNFAKDTGCLGIVPTWNPQRRAQIQAELDAFYAHLYGLSRDELYFILDPIDVMGDNYPSETFRVLKKNEIKTFGEYRTRRLIIEAWDKFF